MVSPAYIMALPQGQAFALLEGNRLFKLRLPLPDASPRAERVESTICTTVVATLMLPVGDGNAVGAF